MLGVDILFPSVLNGLTTGAVYALIALGLTLIYGVLHIINFAHGTLLMLAMYGVYFLNRLAGVDPYLAMPIGFGILSLQYIADIISLITGRDMPFGISVEHLE